MSIDLLIAGPASRDTGGVARYVTEQQRVLPDDIRTRVFDVRTPAGTGWRRFLVAILLSLVDALRFPLRTRPDIVHMHTSYGFAFFRASYYVLVAKLLWRRPVVLHIHGSAFDDFLRSAGRLTAWYQTAILRQADRVVVLSAYWKDILGQRVPAHRIVVVPNAVDPDQYEPKTPERPTVTFVSNLIERKGVPEFVSAIDQLQQNSVPPFAVEIAGDGPLADQVEALAAAHDDISYHGYVSEQRKRELLDGGSLFVLPTHAEGLPIALLEGMAGGNAVVSTHVGSIPEVVDDDNGAVIAPGDTEARTETLEAMLTDADLETMGQTNIQAVETTYSWDVVSERLAETYRELA